MFGMQGKGGSRPFEEELVIAGPKGGQPGGWNKTLSPKPLQACSGPDLLQRAQDGVTQLFRGLNLVPSFLNYYRGLGFITKGSS